MSTIQNSFREQTEGKLTKREKAYILEKKNAVEPFFRVAMMLDTRDPGRILRMETELFKIAKTNKCFLLYIDEIHLALKEELELLIKLKENKSLCLIMSTIVEPKKLPSKLIEGVEIIGLERHNEELMSKVIDDFLKRKPEINPYGAQIKEKLVKDSQGNIRSLKNIMRALRAAKNEFSAKSEELSLAEYEQFRRNCPQGILEDSSADFIPSLQKFFHAGKLDDCMLWIAFLLEGGERPRKIAVRLVKMAAENIGDGDTKALDYALDAYEAILAAKTLDSIAILIKTYTFLCNCKRSNILSAKILERAESGIQAIKKKIPARKRPPYEPKLLYNLDAKRVPENFLKAFPHPLDKGFDRRFMGAFSVFFQDLRYMRSNAD